MTDNGVVGIIMCCVLLSCISVAVFFFVTSGMIWDSYEKLLQVGDYTPEEKETNRKIDFFPGVYWCIVTAIFLGISFYYNSWERSWIVWPVAGVLFVALLGVAKAVVKKK